MSSKIIILGDSGVGKTSLIQVKEVGSMGFQLSTVQPQEISYKQSYGTSEVSISIWDTPGQYTFRNMVKNFLREAVGIVYTFDITKRETFDDLDDWYHFVNDTVQAPLSFIVANKIDLEDDRDVSKAEALKWAEEHGNAILIETSAKTTQGVRELFDSIARKVFELPSTVKQSTVVLKDEKGKKKKKNCCG